jgi:hypothetical protein
MKTMELERTASRPYTCYEAVRNRLSITVRFDNQETNNDWKAFKHMNKLAQRVQFIIIKCIKLEMRKPVPAPLCPPQIPLDQTQDETRAATVGSQRLTA